ncbi:DUF4489 domain-containing protein [Clostridium algidicarnis]|uniref:DUF4489 domain-containing protein n=1 Tax=Clostridium algidicarnis TaxID=37659 RepID=UPI001C0DF0A0|nr:DUF4489 domain-containing protein [Clostridium algidicarnis]MBU3193323.1 DUF4489 domain-containing protein [Clostridium algidicarnis]MCB2286247.1 DUF4489 domain-containing protein [Clostridium algidicarnis]
MERYKAPQKDIERHEHNECCDRHKYAHCCPKSPCEYPVLFECTQGTGTDIPKICPSKPFTARSLGCVTMDTSCLKDPVVKFDFCSIIKHVNTEDNSDLTRLLFGLFKTCDDRQEIQCGTWEYEIDLSANGEALTTSFCFSHCECSSCPGCCTYSVRIIDATNEGRNTLIVSNPSLSVIAKSGH